MKRLVRLSAPGYDLFKLIITALLLAILLFFGLRSCNISPAPIGGAATPGTDPVMTAVPTITAAVATPAVTQTMTAVLPSPSPTSPAPEATTSEVPQTVSAASCDTVLPSRLAATSNARVMRNLNMREAPDITARILQTNLTGTEVQILEGPVCTPQDGSAYLWWKIQLESGAEGWSAETPLRNHIYFLEPLP